MLVKDFQNIELKCEKIKCNAWIILCMGSTNERWSYNIMSLTDLAHTQNDPCNGASTIGIETHNILFV